MNRLQYVLNFDDDDLAANRAGDFSSDQIERLKTAQARSMPVFWGMCMSVFIMLVIGFVFRGFILDMLVLFAPIAGIFALLEYLLSYRAYHRDFEYGVASIQGQLQFLQPKDALLSAERSPVGIRVGDVSFLLLPPQVDVFREGDIYILYYAPRTNSLLSAEKVMSYGRPVEFDEVEYSDELSSNMPMQLKQNRGH